MKKDIPNYKVEDLIVAIIPTEDERFWEVFLINLKDEALTNVLITSRGYGERNKQKVETTVLRYFIEAIPGLDYVKLELISDEVFDLTNEYWVSFNWEGYMYDKKYCFVKGAITEDNFSPVPFLSRKGVMIR